MQLLHDTRRRVRQTAQMFSVTTLLRTLFAPWRRIVTYPGAGLAAHLRAMSDNLVSRMVGFTVRLFVLTAAIITLFLVAVVALVEIVAWPLVPLVAVVAVVKGLLP